jgi:hypothetical protein
MFSIFALQYPQSLAKLQPCMFQTFTFLDGSCETRRLWTDCIVTTSAHLPLPYSPLLLFLPLPFASVTGSFYTLRANQPVTLSSVCLAAHVEDFRRGIGYPFWFGNFASLLDVGKFHPCYPAACVSFHSLGIARKSVYVALWKRVGVTA